MASWRSHTAGRSELWIAAVLLTALAAAGTLGLVVGRPAYAETLTPAWLPLVAAGLTAAIIVYLNARRAIPRLGLAATWGCLLLLLWTASGLPLDLLRAASLLFPGFMPPGVDWPGMAIRALALAALVVLARHALARRPVVSTEPAIWYGYAALVLSLPYPVLKTWWALGGSFGLRWPGADGLAGSFALWLPAVPWLVAAVLSALLIATPHWMPRRLLLAGGWSATCLVAVIGPVACLSFVAALIAGDPLETGGMATWVFGLVYGSWFCWAIAGAAATRSYQVRSRGCAARVGDGPAESEPATRAIGPSGDADRTSILEGKESW